MTPVRDLLAKARLGLGTAQECYTDKDPERACQELSWVIAYVQEAVVEIRNSAEAERKVRAENGR